MIWFIVIAVTMFNHLGLCEALSKMIKYEFKILSCSKCFTFWSCLIYQSLTGVNIIRSIALSFVMAYVAMWFELLLSLLSKCYEWIYTKVFTTEEAITEGSGNTNKTE